MYLLNSHQRAITEERIKSGKKCIDDYEKVLREKGVSENNIEAILCDLRRFVEEMEEEANEYDKREKDLLTKREQEKRQEFINSCHNYEKVVSSVHKAIGKHPFDHSIEETEKFTYSLIRMLIDYTTPVVCGTTFNIGEKDIKSILYHRLNHYSIPENTRVKIQNIISNFWFRGVS